MFIVAFLLIGDAGGALFVELMLLPRKKAGVYNDKANYVTRMLPLTRADLKAYSGIGSGYWLGIAAVGSAFLAGLMGAVNLWVSIFGSSFFSGYVSYLGLDAPGFLAATFDPHTHNMALALMAGVVAIAVVRFGALDSVSMLRKSVTRFGVWVAIIGVVVMTTVYLAIAFANYSPPTLLQNGVDGVNGIAGDDAAMSIIGVGAMIVLVPMILSRAVWKNGVRLTILGTWIAAMTLSIVEGFYIELHQDAFSASLSANDTAFKQSQPMTGLFLLTAVALALLIADYYGVEGFQRRQVGGTALIGLLVVTIGASLWTFLDPTNTGFSFWMYAGGTFLAGLSLLVVAVSLRSVKVFKVRALLGQGTP